MMNRYVDPTQSRMKLAGAALLAFLSLASLGCSPAPPTEPADVTLSVGTGLGEPHLSDQAMQPPELADLQSGKLGADPASYRKGGVTLVQTATAQNGKVEFVPVPKPAPDKAASRPRKGVEFVPPPAGVPQQGAAGNFGEPEDYRKWTPPEVTLFITGQQHGYIEPCGCTGLANQKGGVARRFTLMKELQEKGWPLVPIDGGNLVRRTGRQAEIKLQHSVGALTQMQYQCVGFGPDDLRMGVGELLSVAAAESVEDAMFASANVVLFEEGLMPQYRIIQQGKHTIAMTSILDPEKLEVELPEEIQVKDSAEATKNVLTLIAKDDRKSNFRVLAFFGDEERAKELVRKVPGFDLIVVAGGYGEPKYQAEEVEGSKTRMVLTGNKGMYVGLVGLNTGKPVKYARVALTDEFGDAPEMRKLMKEYQDQLRDVGLDGLGLKPIPHPSGDQFVGTKRCAECHKQAYEVWEGSAHFDATKHVVTPTDDRGDVARHFDPECLSCHVTGWNPQGYYPYQSGYLSLEESTLLHGNGCENCHGPGAKHAAAEAPDSGVPKDQIKQLREQMRLPLERARDKCMECHDLDNSPDFHQEDAFEDEYWPEVEHYGVD